MDGVMSLDAAPVVHAELISDPTASPRFNPTRLWWAAIGAAAGGIAGGAIAGLLALTLDAEPGLAVLGPMGVVATGVIVGAGFLGALGLLAGLAIGEAKAPREVAVAQPERGEIESEVIVRVTLPRSAEPGGSRERVVRRALADAGASVVSTPSASTPAYLDDRPLPRAI
jgi:hypothetical protein